MKDVSEYSPKEYVRAYRSLKKQRLKTSLNNHNELAQVKRANNERLAELNKQKKELQEQYFVKSYGNIDFYVNRVECDGVVVSFEKNYVLDVEKRSETVVVGYYKNGKPRTRNRAYAVVTIAGGGSGIAMRAGSTLSEAKEMKRLTEDMIKAGLPRKAELDKQCRALDKEIEKTEKQNQKDLDAKTAESDKRSGKINDAIAKLLDSGSVEQIKKLFLPSRVVLAVVSIILSFPVVLFGFAGYVHIVRSAIEANSGYQVEVDGELSFDCNLSYDEDKHQFRCAEYSYGGSVKMTGSSLLIGAFNNYDVTVDGESFTKVAPPQIIYADNWAVKDFDPDKIDEYFARSEDKVFVHNMYLGRTVLEKTIAINWKFSDEDKALVRDVWTKWKDSVAASAQKRYDDYLAEVAKQKAEAEAKAKAEAEAKAEEERKAAEEAKKKAEEEAAKNNSSSGSSGSNSSSNSGGSSSGSGVRTGAVCNDGTTSSATGRGACSRHGGVKYWLTK